MALTIDLTGLTDVQWRAIYEFLNRYLVPNIVKEPGGPRGQIFRAYLEQINLVATGQLSIEDFLWNIGDIFPVAGEDNNRFRELAEQAQYNGFLKEFEEILASEDPASAIQGFFERYENVGIADNSIVLGELDSFGGINSFNMASADQIFERMILGDGDWGALVKLCTTTVTTNCVDPTGIKDLWEDFGRHIQVIFKGLPIPGLPDWLPLPGIMRLPTLGEIWDRIIGPFQEEADAQMNECMSQDDDGDGVPNSASYCIENRDIVGIITGTITAGAEQIYKETSDRIKDIVDGELEVPCIEDPQACAEKTKEVLGRIFEGVWDSADPTMPGIPDWVRAIIIAGEYGDEFLDVLEGIINQDVDGDGTIGIQTDQVECWDGSIVEKEEDCPPDTRVTCWDGSKAATEAECPPDTRVTCWDGSKVPTQSDCPPDTRVTCWDGSKAATEADCPADTRTGQTQEDCNRLGRVHIPDAAGTTKGSCGECSDSVNTVDETPGDYNSPCVAPEDPTQQEGDPCNTGAPLNAEGTVGPAPDYACVPNEGTTCTDPETGKDGTIENGQCVVPVTVEPCTDPNRNVDPDDGSCADTCKDGSPAPASGLCPEPVTKIDCTQPRPTGTVTFDLIDAQGRWDAECKDTHCTDGSLIESHVNNDCQLGLTSDCQDPQTDEQKRNCGWQECDTNTANPGLLVESLDQCGAPQPQECVDAEGNPTGATNYPDCNVCPQGQIFNENGICADPTVDCSEITDANYEACGKEKCNDGTFADVGQCPTTVDCSEITDDNYEACGKEKCSDGTFADIGGCLDPEGSCDNGAIDYPTCTECPDGSIPDAIDGCAGPTINCADYNQQTNEDGTCGPCLPGYVKDTSQPDEPCVPAPADPCPAGFALNTANGLCEPVTCPDGESFCEATGKCETAENCPGPDDGGTDGDGGMLSGSSGGRNMFKPVEFNITGDPQLLSRQQFAEQDFLSPLFEGVNDFPIAQFLAGNRKA